MDIKINQVLCYRVKSGKSRIGDLSREGMKIKHIGVNIFLFQEAVYRPRTKEKRKKAYRRRIPINRLKP